MSGVPELRPTLLRYAPPPEAPPHLSVTLARLESARRGETVFVVAEQDVPDGLLERTWDARKTGATVLAIDAGQSELEDVAHESLTVPAGFEQLDSGLVVPEMSFDTVQHLVSVAAGETPTTTPGRRGFRDRLARALETMTGPRTDAL